MVNMNAPPMKYTILWDILHASGLDGTQESICNSEP
jgi:hypothetical protein